MNAIASNCNQLHHIFTQLHQIAFITARIILHLKALFSWDLQLSGEKLKRMLMQNFWGGASKVYYIGNVEVANWHFLAFCNVMSIKKRYLLCQFKKGLKIRGFEAYLENLQTIVNDVDIVRCNTLLAVCDLCNLHFVSTLQTNYLSNYLWKLSKALGAHKGGGESTFPTPIFMPGGSDGILSLCTLFIVLII